jgi:hypothetical protein
MAVGIGTAIALGVGAGVSAYGAHKQAQAAEKASGQQQQSAQQALDLQRQLYEQTRGDLQQNLAQTRGDLGPYMGAGNQGLSSLTSLLGVPAAPRGGGPMTPTAAPLGTMPVGGMVGLGAASGMPQPVGSAAPPGMPSPLTAGLSGMAPAGGGAPGGTVLLRAPTGQTQAVPAEQVAFFLARGATRV